MKTLIISPWMPEGSAIQGEPIILIKIACIVFLFLILCDNKRSLLKG